MAFPDFSGRLLIICPHFDDACFSVGGFLLKKPSESVTLLTVFSKSQHAPNYKLFYPMLRVNDHLKLPFSKRKVIDVISIVRKREDSQFCSHIGAVQSVLPFEDSSARGVDPYNPIFDRNEIDRDLLSKSVFAALEKWVFSGAFDSVLCPLGIGNQVDHLIVTNAFMKVLETNPTPQVNVFFYEDLPYASFYELDFINSLAFERAGSKEARYVDVTNEMFLKQKLMDTYYSQAQEKAPILRYGERLFVSRNQSHRRNGFYERIWKSGPRIKEALLAVYPIL